MVRHYAASAVVDGPLRHVRAIRGDLTPLFVEVFETVFETGAPPHPDELSLA